MKRNADATSPADLPTGKRRSIRQLKDRIAKKSAEVLCTFCATLQIGKYEEDGDYYKSDRLHVERPLGDLYESVQKGCLGCQFFSQMLPLRLRWPLRKDLGDAENLKLTLKQDGYGMAQLQMSNTRFVTQLDVCRVTYTCAETFFRTRELVFRDDQDLAESDQWLDNYGSIARVPRGISSSILTKEMRHMVSAWLGNCSGHDVCRAPTPQPLPTRIIDVCDPDQPRLIESKGAKAEYLTLSHCWGTAEGMYKTTKGNIQEHLSAIPLKSLPPNLKDAIAITAHLGYRYLWIDSLCVIQHDREDWKREAVLMGPYYKRCSFMISASAGGDSTQGLIRDRTAIHSPPFGTVSPVVLRSTLSSDGDLDRLPISARAWTMQERFMAPRVLHFLHNEIVMECGYDTYSEGCLKDTSRTQSSLSKRRLQAILEAELDLESSRKHWPDTPDWAPYRTEHRLRSWYDLVTNFSARSITYASDRMPALAGLAREFAHPALGNYLAGIWSEDVSQGLCWQVDSPEATTALAVAEYLAPSWSWLSVNTACSWNQRLWAFAKKPSSRAQLAEYDHWAQTYKPILVSANIESEFGDVYTSTRMGSYIEIEGYCRPVFVSHAVVTGQADGPNGVVLKQMNFDKPVAQGLTFYFSGAPEGSEELLLLQASKSRGHDLFVQALILQCDEHGHYRRVGTARLENYNLAGIMPVRKGVMAVAYLHPRQTDGRMQDMENIEWQPAKWQKRTIKLF